MMNSATTCKIPWVRDEVILALAFYYTTPNKNFYPLSGGIQQLSKQLQSLPIYFLQPKPADFRNCNGMHYQLSKLHMVLKGGKDLSFLAKVWADVLCYYRDKLDILQMTASAIIQVGKSLSEHNIWVTPHGTLFAEGCILEYFHSIMERGKPCHAQNCMICGMYPSAVYCGKQENFLENHLLIERWNLYPGMKVRDRDVVSLCPNCHKIVHSIRPWISELHSKQILTWENK